MSQPSLIRCGRCQKTLQVVPLAGPSQVTCPGCAATLQIAGTSVASPVEPSVSEPTASGPTTFPADGFSGANPTRSTRPMPAARSARKSAGGIPAWLLIVAVLGLMGMLVCCGGLALYFVLGRNVSSRPGVPIAVSLRATRPPVNLPPPSDLEKTYPSGIKRYFVSLETPADLPGQNMQFRVFVPAGEHADGSLPCVLVAPAGTPMIHGAGLDRGSDYDAETLPYAEAGFVVIQYSLDGAIPSHVNEADEGQMLVAMQRAYPAFKDAGAGVVNGRNALDYAIKRLPMVDLDRISCAGHSSAGSLSLLLAAHEPRIHRCVAFAAAYDLETRMREMTSDFMMRQMFPGIGEFITESSPLNHVDTIQCPTFIFHARDDSNVPIQDAETFVALMNSTGMNVTFEVSPRGGHYQSMVDPGIPLAIEWLQTR